jgi:uncharacterized protein (TIGR03435 family)
MRTFLAATFLVVSGPIAAFSQSTDPAPAFEVASVKVSPPRTEGMRLPQNQILPSPGGVTIQNTSLKGIIQWAYHLQTIQVIGPGWLESDHYDIAAKSSDAVPTERLRQMLQPLLADRFKLAFHRETREMPAYVVTVGKNGLKMTQSQGDGEMQMKPTGKGLNVQFTHVTLAQLAEMASSPLQGVVVDQTGLKGAWDFTLDMSPAMMNRPADREEAIDMIIQVLNDQLGIKIEQKKVPAEVLVVDRAEKVPVEN